VVGQLPKPLSFRARSTTTLWRDAQHVPRRPECFILTDWIVWSQEASLPRFGLYLQDRQCASGENRAEEVSRIILVGALFAGPTAL
jgi:hypothetical protein